MVQRIKVAQKVAQPLLAAPVLLIESSPLRSQEWLRYCGHNEVGIDLVIQKIRSLVPKECFPHLYFFYVGIFRKK